MKEWYDNHREEKRLIIGSAVRTCEGWVLDHWLCAQQPGPAGPADRLRCLSDVFFSNRGLYDLHEAIRILCIRIHMFKTTADIPASANPALWSTTLRQCFCGLEGKTGINKNPNTTGCLQRQQDLIIHHHLYQAGMCGRDTAQEKTGKKQKKPKKQVALFWQALKVTQTKRIVNIPQHFLMSVLFKPRHMKRQSTESVS